VDLSRVPGHRFVCCLQNHDQIGNRAVGDRMTATVSTGRMLCGAAILLCSPYTPMIFMGEEWAAGTPWRFFASFPDPELAESVRTGRRREFAEHGWGEAEIPDPMDPETVVRSTLRWDELSDPRHRAVLDTYRALIRLRRAYPELADPRLDRFAVDADPDHPRLVLHRGTLRVACNLGREPAMIPLDREPGEVLLASAAPTIATDGLTLPPDSFAVLATR
jgi:maltooligosyltrehalose trehalohydrolase